MTKQENIAVGLIIAGIVAAVIALIADINGGPSWLHGITWVSGFAGGYGVVTLITARRR